MEKYENMGTIGEGSYGVVIKCRDKTNGNVVAIKKFLESENDRAVKKIAFREIKILKSLRHDNLVNLIEVFRRNRRIYLVFEYIDQNLLEEIERSRHGVGEDKTREIMFQVVRGIDFMHSNNIIHRDIKPENILINTSGLVKLCDFGFARQIAQPNEVYTDYVATRWYRSPELLVGDPKYGKPVDIWSIGVLTYEVLTSRPLYPGESDLDQLFLIMNSIGDITDSMKQCFNKNQFYMNSKLPKIKNFSPLQNKLKKYSSNLIKFIMDSLIIDPVKRYTSSELMQHNFFLDNSWNEEFVIKLKKLVVQHESSVNLSRGLIVESVLGRGDNESVKNVTIEKPKEQTITLNITQKQSQNNLFSNAQTISNPNINQTKVNNSINNFFHQTQSEDGIAANNSTITDINANNNLKHILNNQKFVKNVTIKPNFLVNGKDNEYFTSTVVNNSIKKFNPKKNLSKDVEIKTSKILPKIENQQPLQSESPRLEITHHKNSNNYTTLSFNLYKQQNNFSNKNINNNNNSNDNNYNNNTSVNMTSFSNLSMRKSPNNESYLTNSSLGILNDLNISSIKRSNSNNNITTTNTSSQNKPINYFADENFKLSKKQNNLTSSNSDLNGVNSQNNKTSLSRLENIKNVDRNNVRLPQMKNFDKKKYNFKI